MSDDKVRQIYYLIAYDVNAGKWMNADHVLGAINQGANLYEADEVGEEGEWKTIDAFMPELQELDSDNIKVLSKFLREQNGLPDPSLPPEDSE